MSFELLQKFIDHPTFEKVESCRKDDFCVLQHILILLCRNMVVKKDIKNKLLERLIELKVLDVPVNAAQPWAEVSSEPCVSVLESKEEQATLATPPEGVDVDECEAHPATLPRFEPFTPEAYGSSAGARLKVRLARLQLEAQEEELVHKAHYDLRLQVLEIEAEKEVKLKQLEVEAMKITSLTNISDNTAPSLHKQGFDVSRHISSPFVNQKLTLILTPLNVSPLHSIGLGICGLSCFNVS